VGYYIGVDLGTTYTAAAVARDDRVEVAALGDHSTAVPSVLWIGEQGEILVGEAAQRRGLSDPTRVAREFKRRLGDTTPLLLGGTPYSVESLSARLLSWVVAEVARTEGSAPDGVAVTHPANWGAYKKDLLAQAVRLADLPAATTLTEPQAAAIFYASQQRVEPGDVIAVFDLGGGTFDAAVIRKVDEGRFDILGEPEGIERLGGIDFDDAVFAHVAGLAQSGIDALDPDDSTAMTSVARLREECVQAKEVLSSDTEVSIPVLLPSMSTEVRLTRAEFEAMIRPRMEDAIGAMRRSLTSAKVEPKDIRAILLVGGSSRIPLVAQMVSAAFGRPVAVDAHPKNAIAMGAAIAARIAAVGITTAAAEVTEPSLPVQPDRGDTDILAAATTAAALGGAAAAAADLPPVDSAPTSTFRASPPPPPPPVRKERRSPIAMLLPIILGIALLGGGSYYMFGRHSKAAKTVGVSQTPPAKQPTGGGTHPVASPTPHPIQTLDLLLTPATTTTPVDTSGSTDCNEVAAAANGLTPTDPGPGFTSSCQTATWSLSGAPEKVVTFFSSSTATSAPPPKVEVLTQNPSDQTWTPVLEADSTSTNWSTATVSVANLTGSNEVDPEFVVVFHEPNDTQQIAIVQSNNGAPFVAGQTGDAAFHASVVIQGATISLYASKTADSSPRLDTIRWVPSQNSYYGLFTPLTSPAPTSTL
jgi:cell division ATPase FtsA